MVIHARKNGAANDRRTRTPRCRPLGHIIGGTRAAWYVTSDTTADVTCARCRRLIEADTKAVAPFADIPQSATRDRQLDMWRQA